MNNLTTKQLKYLKVIKHFYQTIGKFPTLKELTKAMGNTGKSTQGTRDVLKRLIQKGYLGKKDYYEVKITKDLKHGEAIKREYTSPYYLKGGDST